MPADESITPTESVFVVHHYAAPAPLIRSTWALDVTGEVEHPIVFDLDTLASMPLRQLRAVMECSGNSRWSFSPITTGTQFRNGVLAAVEWSGVPLRALLDRVNPRPTAQSVVVFGADGPAGEPFAKGLPLDKASDPDTILAMEMNGAEISHLHGGPVRLIVPGWYGIWSVKWVTRIELLDHAFQGYWQRERYVYKWPDSRPPSVLTSLGLKSLIAQPAENAELVPGTYRVAGYAWSDGADIAGVQVRFNDGDWRDAKISPASEKYEWATWEYSWEAAPGRYAITSRAVDAAGNRQPEMPPWNSLGYANNSVQAVVVDVLF
jgi:DMSO/TMAO reductase YedYZ molybdopterin-dependent catalytic subunit